jgi:Zn-dependent protease with chaperone function
MMALSGIASLQQTEVSIYYDNRCTNISNYEDQRQMDRIPPEAKVAAEGANAFILSLPLGKTLAGLFSTHPSLEKRIENLEKVKSEIRGY